MKYKVVIRPEAESDLLDAIKWYENRSKGLGVNFLKCIDNTIDSILNSPEAHINVYKNIRRALVRKFPFVIYYIIENTTIIILAIFHTRRKPKDWVKNH